MANPENGTPPGDFEPGPAGKVKVSLSQALLAPLDAIFKAQLHGARSFLNMLLQLGYPDEEAARRAQAAGGGGVPAVAKDGKPFTISFYHDTTIDNRTVRQQIEVPALALVPIAPLAVQSAEFRLSFHVTDVDEHKQVQEIREKVRTDAGVPVAEKPPWYLVRNPLSLRGNLAPPGPAASAGEGAPQGEASSRSESSSRIEIEVKVGTVQMPSGLDRLLTSLNQLSELRTLPPKQGESELKK